MKGLLSTALLLCGGCWISDKELTAALGGAGGGDTGLTTEGADSDDPVETGGSDTGEAADGDGDGWTVKEGDCDDSDAGVYPGAPDGSCDGVDQNCDGLDGVDGDGDGVASVSTCGEDCDDEDADINPGASEVWYDGIDQDCDDSNEYDADGDGRDSENYGGTDCNDEVFEAWPGHEEIWYDGVDNDCLGGSDYDADEDGDDSAEHGGDDCWDDPGTSPEDFSGSGLSADQVGPTAAESWYDGFDQDCDGESDYDADRDGYDGYDDLGEPAGDCDDDPETGPDINPGAAEGWYDGVDQDCGGDNDYDADGDGYVADGYEDQAGGTAPETDDCLDADATSNPGAAEVWYDGVDGNCDEWSDYDADGDGYDRDLDGGDDCEDAEVTVNPAGTEICRDGLDNDCDGDVGPCSLSLSTADAKLAGVSDGNAGKSVSGAGDVNGDGNDDLIIGAPYDDSGGDAAGVAYLVYGPVTGDMPLSDADAILVGEEAGDFAGYSVSGAGDVDGDGYEDLIVGAYLYGEDDNGAAYLVLGPVTAGLDLSDANARFVGEAAGDYAGVSVSSAGDVNNDGSSDLLIGARYADSNGLDAGATYLVLGPASVDGDLGDAHHAKLVGEVAGDEAGEFVSEVGDANGDSFDDILIGACDDSAGGLSAGAAYLVHGPITGTSDLSDADAKYTGEAPSDYACRVSGAGDVDGDGNADVLIGANFESSVASSAGAAYLVLGATSSGDLGTVSQAKLAGGGAGHRAGYSVSKAGDVDSNGYDDLLIGAILEDTVGVGAGAAYLVLGPVTGWQSLLSSDIRLNGEDSGDSSGGSVSGVGDVNGDGVPDLLVGAENNDSTGAAYLFYGGWM